MALLRSASPALRIKSVELTAGQAFAYGDSIDGQAPWMRETRRRPQGGIATGVRPDLAGLRLLICE